MLCVTLHVLYLWGVLFTVAVRKRRADNSTSSPDTPASTGRPRVGRVSLEECHRLRSLLGGPGSARMPGRVPSEDSFCPRKAWVRLVSLQLPRLLHTRLRALCAVVKGHRQLHGYRQPLMPQPCPEPAFSPPCRRLSRVPSWRPPKSLAQCDTKVTVRETLGGGGGADG